MGKSCWMASLTIQPHFPIQILLTFQIFKLPSNFIFQCYIPDPRLNQLSSSEQDPAASSILRVFNLSCAMNFLTWEIGFWSKYAIINSSKSCGEIWIDIAYLYNNYSAYIIIIIIIIRVTVAHHWNWLSRNFEFAMRLCVLYQIKSIYLSTLLKFLNI